jgi:hypothetical protein
MHRITPFSIATVALLCIAGCGHVTPEVSPEGQIRAFFDQYIDAMKRGAVEAAMLQFHPRFTRWNLTRERPASREEVERGFRAYLSRYTVVSYEVEFLSVETAGNAGVVHLRYREIVRDQAGIESVNAGRWTATLERTSGRWRFLSSAFVPANDK